MVGVWFSMFRYVSVTVKRGSLEVSTLAFSARGHGFDPHGRPGKMLVSKNAFLSVFYRDDNKCVVLWVAMLTGGPLCRESHPLCRLQNPTVVYLITCRVSSCKTGVYNVHLLIILKRWCRVHVCIEQKKERKGEEKTHGPGHPTTLAYGRAGPAVLAAGAGQVGCFF